MLKKWMAALLLCALAVCGAAAESADAIYGGLWADPDFERVELSIVPVSPEDAGESWFAVTLTWGSSAAEHSAWTMRAKYDGRGLAYEDGKLENITLQEDGRPEKVVEVWSDARGRFTLWEDGRLRWEDSREPTAPEFRFERQLKFAPAADDLAEGFLRPIADLETGTAGYSLKLAIRTCEAVRFAWGNALWNADVQGLRDNLAAAWERLDADARQRFYENFPEVVRLADAAFANCAEARGTFDDAGVGEDMALMAASPEARQSWRTLEGYTLALDK